MKQTLYIKSYTQGDSIDYKPFNLEICGWEQVYLNNSQSIQMFNYTVNISNFESILEFKNYSQYFACNSTQCPITKYDIAVLNPLN